MFEIQLPDEESVEYIPDFQNNRELAESWADDDGDGERPFFWVELLPLSGHDYNQAHGRAFKAARKDADFVSASNKLRNRLIKKYVVKVAGLKAVGRDGEIRKPQNGTQLIALIQDGYPALDDILDDIHGALKDISKADEGSLKKLQQRSDGSEQKTTHPTSGGVASATQTMSTTMTDPPRLATALRETVTP